QSAEKMAKAFGIRREDQDRFAFRSPQRAVDAWERGALGPRVVAVSAPKGEGGALTVVERDDHPRADTTLERLAALRPVFDRKLGSVTAGNASPLTDGASALILAAEEVARAEGWPILGILRDYEYAAVDPFEHLLMGPVAAVARALDRNGLGLGDLGVIEMHEAFAAQVLANIHGLGSAEYCAQKLGRAAAVEVEARRERPAEEGADLATELGLEPAAALGLRQGADREEAGDQLGRADPVEVGAAQRALLVDRIALEEAGDSLGDRRVDRRLVDRRRGRVEAADEGREGAGEALSIHRGTIARGWTRRQIAGASRWVGVGCAAR
ncbi:MAG: hypothetical protein KC420_21995, partial [Myxococcales bacterium]|nr:hypothetical protein [Myxococcales bacterium]